MDHRTFHLEYSPRSHWRFSEEAEDFPEELWDLASWETGQRKPRAKRRRAAR